MVTNLMLSIDVFDTEIYSWSTLGFVLLGVGVVATLFSAHRYLLGYMVAGMAYWLVIEGLHAFIASYSSLTDWNSYMAALTITWLPLAIALAYRYAHKPNVLSSAELVASPQPTKASEATGLSSEKYIEHTPVYSNYEPRFPS